MMEKRFPEERLNKVMAASWHVNMADCRLHFDVLDYMQKDIGESFFLRRSYVAGGERRGSQVLGRFWLLGFAGRLSRYHEKLRILMEDYHWQNFLLQDGKWIPQSDGERYLLREERNGWTLLDRVAHAECFFDKEGRLCRKQVEKRPAVEISYDGDSMQEIHLSSGQVIVAEYAENKLSKLKDALGRLISYSYDGDKLIAVTYPNGGIVRYSYTEEGRLLSYTDAENICQAEFSYDEEGHVTRAELSDGSFAEYIYEPQNRRTTERWSDGTEKIYYWNRQKLVERICYEGKEEQYRYDSEGRRAFYQDTTGAVWKWAYDAEGRLLSEVFPSGYKRTIVYDKDGFPVRENDNCGSEIFRRYSPQGWMIEEKTLLGRNEWRILRKEWDRLGRCAAEGTNGNIIRYTYDGTAPVPSMLETACGEKFSFRYDKVWRRLVIRSEFGERSFGWNPLDALVRDSDAVGKEKRFSYDLCGNPMGKAEKVQEKKAKEKHFADCRYDMQGRLTESQTEAQRAAGFDSVDFRTFYKYGIDGILEERSAYEMRDGEVLYTLRRWKYDADGNEIEERLWLDGQTVSSASGRVRTLKKSYDVMGRLLSVEDSLGSRQEYQYNSLGCCTLERRLIAEDMVQIFRYLYDAAGNLIAREERMDYARKGALWAHEDGDADYFKASDFQKDGRLADALGEVLERNAAGWPILLKKENGEKIQLGYDAAGNVRSIRVNGEEAESFRHDIWGRVTEHGTVKGKEYFSYDFAGNIVGTMDTDGRRNQYRYDENNELFERAEEGPDIRENAAGIFAERAPHSLYEALWNGVRCYMDLAGYRQE